MQSYIFLVGVALLVQIARSQGPGSSISSTVSRSDDSYNQQTIDPSFTKSLASFAVDFYEVIINTFGRNVIMSPFSAQTALSLLYCGADRQTKSIMAKALDYKRVDQTQIAHQFDIMLKPFHMDPSLTIANAIYVMRGYEIQEDYLAIAEHDFRSSVTRVDFSHNYEAANEINNWVATETHDKITNLISPDDLNEDTRLVLLNAIYFKGTWKYKFPLDETWPELFHRNSKSETTVQMMHVKAKFNYNYLNDLASQVIELSYDNSKISMVLILPDSYDGIRNLQDRLRKFDLSQISSKLYEQKVDLSMPKFKIETTLDLNDPLDTLGMGNIFTNDADFSNMLMDQSGYSEQLKVSKVVQKAYIEVDEEGATAAAATGAIGTAMAMPINPPPIIKFKADHPFIFLLKTPDTVLFVGTFKPNPMLN